MEQYFTDYLVWLTTLCNQFRETIADLPQDGLDWVAGEDMNSLCVLVVHTMAAGRFWMGDVPLGELSNRDRPSEFMAKGLSEAELNQKIDNFLTYAQEAMPKFSFDMLATLCVVPSMHNINPPPGNRKPGGREVTAGWSLLHALEHTAGHLGHAQLTRQLWDQRAK